MWLFFWSILHSSIQYLLQILFKYLKLSFCKLNTETVQKYFWIWSWKFRILVRENRGNQLIKIWGTLAKTHLNIVFEFTEIHFVLVAVQVLKQFIFHYSWLNLLFFNEIVIFSFGRVIDGSLFFVRPLDI